MTGNKKHTHRPPHGKKPRSKQVVDRPVQEVVKTPMAEPLSPEAQAAAVQRVARSFRELAKAPEGFVEWLERLEIPYVVEPLEEFSEDLYLIVSIRDLIEGEGRNQEKGSVLQQIYGDKTAELTGMFQQIRTKIEGTEGDALSHG